MGLDMGTLDTLARSRRMKVWDRVRLKMQSRQGLEYAAYLDSSLNTFCFSKTVSYDMAVGLADIWGMKWNGKMGCWVGEEGDRVIEMVKKEER